MCQYYMVDEFSGGVYMVQYIYMLIGRVRVCQYYMVAEFSGGVYMVYLHVDFGDKAGPAATEAEFSFIHISTYNYW